MTVELRPLGVACNLACTYCYQNAIREAGNVKAKYNLDVMKSAIEKEGGPFALFGGEPLLLPIDDLESLLSWGYQKYGSNSLQTNGVLLRDEHIDMFRKYNVGIGVSLDGPDELNDARRAGSLEYTREQTRKSLASLQRLLQSGITPTVIVTLHRLNSVGERLTRLANWIYTLDAAGVKFLRLHILEIDNQRTRDELALTDDENIEAFRVMANLRGQLKHLRFDVFSETEALLAGRDDHVSCVWRACDPHTTQAVRGIEGNGQRSNCSRTNKLGIEFLKATSPNYERYLALYHTPYDDGGCSGCRFFIFCKGQCPGTAIDGDWRNRSESCQVWFSLFEMAEQALVAKGFSPLSRRPLLQQLENSMLASWTNGTNPSIQSLLSRVT
jgi:uncharacterized protein